MANCDPKELVSEAACFTGLSPKQFGMVTLALLCRIMRGGDPMASCDVNDLMRDAKCFAGLPTNQQMAIQTQLLCEILNGGGSGTTCIIGCPVTGPVIPGPCAHSLAYSDPPNPGVWLWNDSSGLWDEIISPGP